MMWGGGTEACAHKGGGDECKSPAAGGRSTKVGDAGIKSTFEVERLRRSLRRGVYVSCAGRERGVWVDGRMSEGRVSTG